MLAIYKKELNSYMNSPIAYVVMAVFILLNSIFFFWPAMSSGIGDASMGFGTMSFMLIIIIPILTMRILAEERKNGTEVMLMTSPVNIWGIVFGKFLAIFVVYLITLALTLVYPIIMVLFGGVITPQLIGGYIGIILLGASYISIGVFASSLTENQVIAVVVTYGSLLIIMVADAISGMVGGIIGKILGWISLVTRYDEISSGILSLTPIIYFISFTGAFLFLTVRVIEKRRWS